MGDAKTKEEKLEEENTSVGHSAGSKAIFLIGGAIGVSILLYFLLFSEPDEQSNGVNNDAIVLPNTSKGGALKVNTFSEKVYDPVKDSFDALPVVNDLDMNTENTETDISSVPAVPQLSEDIKQMIAPPTPPTPTETVVEKEKEPTYSKEEVEQMIQNRIKEAMEENMTSFIDNNNKKGATSDGKITIKQPVRKRVPKVNPSTGQTEFVEEVTEEDVVVDANSVDANGNVIDNTGGNKSATTKTANNTSSADEGDEEDEEDVLILDAPTTSKKTAKNKEKNATATDEGGDTEEEEDDEALADEASQQADELNRIAKNRAMQERKTAPMFKMNKGNGPSDSIDPNEDAIILTFMEGTKINMEAKKPDVTPQQVQDLTNMILQGKVIAAVLETAIDTSVPSTARAVVTKDIFAEEGKNILIPRGSRIIGSYSAKVDSGQTRVTINWNRIIRVDGMSMNITSIGADRLGRAGVPGELDNKYAQRLANSFLSSVLSVGSAYLGEKVAGATGQQSTLSGLTGDILTESISPVSKALNDSTANFMKEAKDIVDTIAKQEPVIRIPQGQKITIMVTQDVTLPVYTRNN